MSQIYIANIAATLKFVLKVSKTGKVWKISFHSFKRKKKKKEGKKVFFWVWKYVSYLFSEFSLGSTQITSNKKPFSVWSCQY